MPLCHSFHLFKSFFYHQHVCSLIKPLFFTVDNVPVTLHICNAVKYVSSTHGKHKVLPWAHNSIHILRHISCPGNDNVADSHLPLTNLLSFSETIFPSSLTSDLNFCSVCTFSLPEISSSRIFHHVYSSAKFSLFLMILFNAILLHQPIKNVPFFNILADFTLFLLVCWKFYYKTCGTMTFYIKWHKNLL